MAEDARSRPAASSRPSPAPVPHGRGVRARLARHRARKQVGNPVLEPLFRAVRANHPKADLALLERAYDRREAHARPDAARAATRTSPTRSRSPRSWPTSA